MMFGNFFGNKSQLPGTGGGKFERHRNLLSDKGAFGTFGVSLPDAEKLLLLRIWLRGCQVICGGFGEDELEVLAETLENVLSSADARNIRNIPVAVLGKSDLDETLEDMLGSLNERDR